MKKKKSLKNRAKAGQTVIDDGKAGYRRPPKATQFKKGQSGNPEGARAHNPAIKALKALTIESFREIIELVMKGNLQSLKSVINDPDTSAVQVGIAKAFLKAIRNGDYTVIEKIAERIVGKIPDQLNITSPEFNKKLFDEAQSKFKSDI